MSTSASPASRAVTSPASNAVLASIDRPFVIERPDELRGLAAALPDRLAAAARGG